MALENFTDSDAEIRNYLIQELDSVNGVEVVAKESRAINSVISLTVSGASGEHLLRELAIHGIDIDSGSACNPADLQPSHVLAAMGYPTDGHLRATLHPGTNREDIDLLIGALKKTIETLCG
jgi:cysteine desulfurase